MKQRPENKLDFYIDLRELTQRLSCSPRTVRDYIADVENPLPAYKFKGKYLFFWPEVQAWIATHKVQPVDMVSMVDEIVSDLKGKA